MSLIVVGSANMDLVVRAPRFPEPGETILGTRFATYPGGKGANQAVAAGRLGGDVRFVGRVGRDAFGKQLRRSLTDAGIDVAGLVDDPQEATGIAAITVTDWGQNTIVVAPGANGCVTAQEAMPWISPEDTLLLQLEIPLETVCELCLHSRAKLKILNPAPAAALPSEFYPCIDLLTPNETEAHLLTGVEVIDFETACRAADKLHDRGTRNVIVTLGDRGCFYSNGEIRREYPAHAVTPVDTTAAGDAFSGALALFLSQGESFEDAVPKASVAAALSTTKPGAQASMPTLADLREHLG